MALTVATVSAIVVLKPTDETPQAPPASPPYLTVFLVDGLMQQPFESELAAGRLPHIQAMTEDGLYVRNGIASFPTMTGYGFYPFLTGEPASHSETMALRWLDRSREKGPLRNYVGRTHIHMNDDFVSSPRTLYERVQPAFTVSQNSYSNRGVSRSLFAGADFMFAKYRDTPSPISTLANLPGIGGFVPDFFEAESNVIQMAMRELKHRPKVQWVTFTSTDAVQHVHGTTSAYLELVRYIDGLIGEYREESRRLGLEADRIYAVLSDHGAEDVHENIDLTPELTSLGVRTFREPAVRSFSTELSESWAHYEDYDAILLVNGNLINSIYVRGEDGDFRTRAHTHDVTGASGGSSQIDLVGSILRNEGVEHVLTLAEDDTVVVHGKRGTGRIERRGATYRYTFHGNDPFEYEAAMGASFLDQHHSKSDWLKHTYATTFPAAVPRAFDAMTSRAAPDLLVLAAPGVDLAADYEMFVGNYKGGHGGLRAEQIRVPYVLSGPGVPKGETRDAAYAEDIGKLLQTWTTAASAP